MSNAVFLREEAREDLAAATLWYAEQRDGLQIDFLDEILAVFSRIGSSPQQFPKVYRDTRRALCWRFPYTVYFRMSNAGVVVIAVLHQAQSPARWRRR